MLFPCCQLEIIRMVFDLGSITSRCSGKEPATAGRVRILLLVLANQITARRFLLGINYLVSEQSGIDKWHAKELQRQLRSKV